MTMRDLNLAPSGRRVMGSVAGIAVGIAMYGAVVIAPAAAAPYPPVAPTVPVGAGSPAGPGGGGQAVAPGGQAGGRVPAAQPYRGGTGVEPASFPVQAQTGSGPADHHDSADVTVPFALLGVGLTAVAAAGVVVSRRRPA